MLICMNGLAHGVVHDGIFGLSMHCAESWW